MNYRQQIEQHLDETVTQAPAAIAFTVTGQRPSLEEVTTSLAMMTTALRWSVLLLADALDRLFETPELEQ